MTVDRHQAVCNPMVKFQRARTRFNIPVCVAWCVSFVGSVPQIFIFSRIEVEPGVFDCWATFIQPWGLQTYVTWTTLVIFVCPVITVLICQVRICRAIQMNLYQKAPLAHRANGLAGMSKARLWSAWDSNAPKETATFTILMLLASLNSCANPCIYLTFSGQIPKGC
ncbi:hypothetical protein WMY93_030933 [Mugilogobius chulae]|uniref:G-protein coupled receptors family 1 profile domain-containing protein n=1 Tax=Mugilogobius chulae TaxID=88201 RepID=A0AAW0MKD1_9GOBI